MPTYNISGVPVEFPYDAYDCQIAYMQAVVQALSAGENALLESPTGTGKTLCLLCAALGWRRHQEKVIAAARTSWEAQSDPNMPSMANACPRIWYSSRTHSQLKQVVRELKRTSYKPSSVVLGSREHFCIHALVSKASGTRQNAMCKRARDENKCPFYVGLRKGQGSKVSTGSMDIEEIVTACRDCQVCPFYKMRDDAKDSELLFIPYDYLINPQTRESLNVSLKNSVIIFDEGHNIEKSCESVASFDLTPMDLAYAIAELDDAFDMLERELGATEAMNDMSPKELMVHINLLKKNLNALEDTIYSVELNHDPSTNRKMLNTSGSYIIEVVSKGSDRGDGITLKDMKRISTVVRLATYVLNYGNESANSGGLYLDKVLAMFTAIFKPTPEELDMNYRCLLYEDALDESKRGTKRKATSFFDASGASAADGPHRNLCLWCFSCSVALKDFEQHGVRSLIVTSGTLSPIEGTKEAFGIPFPVVLENKHVINSSKQLWGGIVPTGPGGSFLDGSYGERNRPDYIQDLGQTVLHYSACVPDGVLLAFQSYAQKEAILKAWKQTGIYEEIQKHKPVFEETSNNFECKQMMGRFTDAVMQAATPSRPVGGAVLAAVCRGKLCEGIDFTDRQCRLVIMVGIPYPQKMDLRVKMKEKFLDARGQEGDGQKWYVREAIRAINQTVGRVIRHRNDFGAVLLCDHRYARDGRLGQLVYGLPSWLRSELSVLSSFDHALAACRRFFGVSSVQQFTPAQPSVSGRTDVQQQMPEGSPAQSNVPDKAAAQDQQTLARGLVIGAAPTNVNKTIAASGDKTGAARGTPLSALGALWKDHRKASSSSSLGASTKASSSSSLGASTKDVKGAIPSVGVGTRRYATPLVSATSTRNAVQAVATKAARTPGVVMESGWTRLDDWMRATQGLLPRMEFDILRENVTTLQAQAESIISNTNVGQEVEQRLQASMQSIAEILLPEFNFDTPAEQQKRSRLVQEFMCVMPKLIRSLWRKCVDDLFKSRCEPLFAWGK